ncbi:MAG: TIGR00288 family NYN domain-containing protein [Candidatus Bilamarchaeaceae archaeon]
MDFFNLFGKKNHHNIAVLVDGPNTIRKSVNIDLKRVKAELSRFGRIRVGKVYLDQYASEKLIEAMVNQGFDTRITTGDVDVTMAIEGMEYLLDPKIDIVALMTRDTDYLPLISKARERGKYVFILATDVAFSVALKNSADVVIIFNPDGKVEYVFNNPEMRFRSPDHL